MVEVLMVAMPRSGALREVSALYHIMNWIQIHQLEGHVRPMRATGNFFSEREINGVDLFHLSISLDSPEGIYQ
jgi:hypothetical protein